MSWLILTSASESLDLVRSTQKNQPNEKKRRKLKSQQQQTLGAEVGSALVVTDLSGLCLSQSVSFLVYALSFVSLLVSILRLSELPLLSFLLNPCYPSLASVHAVPVPVPVPVTDFAISMPKTFRGLGTDSLSFPVRGYGGALSKRLKEQFCLLTQRPRGTDCCIFIAGVTPVGPEVTSGLALKEGRAVMA